MKRELYMIRIASSFSSILNLGKHPRFTKGIFNPRATLHGIGMHSSTAIIKPYPEDICNPILGKGGKRSEAFYRKVLHPPS